MNRLGIIMKKEWHFFLGSDRGVFFLYLFLIVSWSMMLVTPHDTGIATGSFWLVFFSVIVSANFSNTVFIAERLNGTMEILITSGLSRKHILFGKMLFVAITGGIIGFFCIGLAYLWKHLLYSDSTFGLTYVDYLTYLSAVFFNTASGAYLSLKLSNPRLMNLATILILALIITAHTLVDYFIPLPAFTLSVFLTIAGFIWTLLALRIYESEKILLPVAL